MLNSVSVKHQEHLSPSGAHHLEQDELEVPWAVLQEKWLGNALNSNGFFYPKVLIEFKDSRQGIGGLAASLLSETLEQIKFEGTSSSFRAGPETPCLSWRQIRAAQKGQANTALM